jgi:hypothetical protein
MYQPPQNPDEPMYTPPQQPSYPQQMPQGYPPQQPYYPPSYVPPPQKRSRTWLWIVLGVLAILILGCIGVSTLILHSAGTAINSVATTVASTVTAASTQPQSSTPQHFKVGELVTVGTTWQITVQSAKTSAGSGFYKPQKAGDVFLIFIVSMKNISSSEQTVSSLVQWSVADSTGQKYNPTLDPDAGASLDGKVEAGSPLKGSLVYEIPKSVHQLTLAFEADITSPGQTIWDISV